MPNEKCKYMLFCVFLRSIILFVITMSHISFLIRLLLLLFLRFLVWRSKYLLSVLAVVVFEPEFVNWSRGPGLVTVFFHIDNCSTFFAFHSQWCLRLSIKRKVIGLQRNLFITDWNLGTNLYLCEFVCECPYLVASMCCCWGLVERRLLALVAVLLLDCRNDALLFDSASSVSVWFCTCRTLCNSIAE